MHSYNSYFTLVPFSVDASVSLVIRISWIPSLGHMAVSHWIQVQVSDKGSLWGYMEKGEQEGKLLFPCVSLSFVVFWSIPCVHLQTFEGKWLL